MADFWNALLRKVHHGPLRQAAKRITRRARRLVFDPLERRDMLSANVIGDFNNDGADDLAIGVPYEAVGGIYDAGAVNVIYGTTGVGLTSAGNQFWHQNVSGVLDAAAADEQFGSSLAAGDFNGDTFDDLAIGTPFHTVSGVPYAGIVQVLFGSAAGLSAFGNQLWHQDKTGILDSAEELDQFGNSLATGDFNADGTDDLAIGIGNEGLGAATQAGAVNVLYGLLGVGLTAAGNQFWNQNSSGILDVAETLDRFGMTLATGDFNGDGSDDLAVGANRESFAGSTSSEGAVHVLFGSEGTGLSSAGNQFWHQNSSGIEDVAEKDDLFGASLAAGDFNGDSRDDLAIGVPGEDVNAALDGGAVNVIYGSASGLTAAGDQFWSQDSSGILDVAEFNLNGFIGDTFGASLQAGHFNSDGREDLAIGVPGESFGTITAAGAVNVIYGSAAGLSSAGNRIFSQDTPGILSDIARGEVFGLMLAVGDFDGDARTDLAIAVPVEAVSGVLRAGAINIMYGSNSGLVVARNQFFHQDSSGILDSAEEEDYFGTTILGGFGISELGLGFGI